MRVLLSGMTLMQANRPRRRNYNTSINAFYHALKAAKHNVEWRPLEYNERGLDKYDLLILGLGTVSEFSCVYLYETLLATRSKKVLYLVNDWKANSTIRLLRDTDIFRDFVFKNNSGHGLDRKKVAKDGALIEKCREKMFQHKDLIGPFFEGWGDRDIIINDTPFKEIYEFDPSTFYLKQWGKIKTLPFKERTKCWVYGALSNYSKWHERLGAKWRIHAFDKKTFIPEEELIKFWYARSIGCIFPKYKASGSGWWRARYCHAILCNNIIYGDPSEFEGLDEEFWRGNINEIEEMELSQLRRYADFQHITLTNEMPKWNHVIDTVDTIVRSVK